MKKTILISLFILPSWLSNAQLAKNSCILGGEFDITVETIKNSSVYSVDKQTTDHYTLNPYAGVMTSPDFGIGLGVGYEYMHEENPSSSYTGYSTTENLFTIQPFLSFYHNFSEKFGIRNRFAPFVGFGKQKLTSSSYTNTEIKEKATEYGFDYSLNLYYLITDKIGLQVKAMGMSFTHATVEPDGGISTTEKVSGDQILLNSVLTQATVGIEFYIGSKSKKAKNAIPVK